MIGERVLEPSQLTPCFLWTNFHWPTEVVSSWLISESLWEIQKVDRPESRYLSRGSASRRELSVSLSEAFNGYLASGLIASSLPACPPNLRDPQCHETAYSQHQGLTALEVQEERDECKDEHKGEH